MRGAQQMAYPQVVGSGADACTIHYSRNDKVLPRRLAVQGCCVAHQVERLFRATIESLCQSSALHAGLLCHRCMCLQHVRGHVWAVPLCQYFSVSSIRMHKCRSEHKLHTVSWFGLEVFREICTS